MFRFTLRDVLWLTVVVGMGVTWSTQYATLRHERELLNAERELAKAKRKEADVMFLRVVDATDRLNDQQAREQRAKSEN